YEGIKKLSHMFVKWGGHASAAGLTIRVEDIGRFERYIDEVFSEMKKEGPKLYIDILLEPKDVKEDVLKSLIKLEPYGEGFPAPVFMSNPLRVERVEGNAERLVLRSNYGVHFVSYNPNINKRLISLGSVQRRIAYTVDAKRRVFTMVDAEDS
ncbi:MAG: single-stranded-DNA-specific exonuclease RecJ, partial [Aquificaceae bacterium]